MLIIIDRVGFLFYRNYVNGTLERAQAILN